MKGIIFNLLEEVVTTRYGADVWDDMLDASSVDGAYTAVGSYGDAEFRRLLTVLPADVLSSGNDPLRWFGRAAMPVLAERYPVFFTGHRSTRSFILTLNEIIHPEVRKLYPGADVPVFDLDDDLGEEQRVVLGYRSSRHLCRLAEGFIEGAAALFGDRADLRQSACMLDGADRCILECDLVPAAAPAPVRV